MFDACTVSVCVKRHRSSQEGLNLPCPHAAASSPAEVVCEVLRRRKLACTFCVTGSRLYVPSAHGCRFAHQNEGQSPWLGRVGHCPQNLLSAASQQAAMSPPWTQLRRSSNLLSTGKMSHQPFSSTDCFTVKCKGSGCISIPRIAIKTAH